MRKIPRKKIIPINSLEEKFDKGIAVGKVTYDDLISFEEAEHAHRHDYHFFILQVKGTTIIEIDFEEYKINESTIVYINPNQVHRIINKNESSAFIMVISNEQLRAENLQLLEKYTPIHPLSLSKENSILLTESLLLSIKIFKRENDKLHLPILKESCNMIVALMSSFFLERNEFIEGISRFEQITKSFKSELEDNFKVLKRPSDYAKRMNISIPYLNECIKTATGHPVSYHIQQRIVLEAKRLLFHTSSSVKEIANSLGYEDYAYFSRLFRKVAGITASGFRSKNLD